MGVLSLITFIPLLGSVLILFLNAENKKAIRALATLFAAVPLALSVWVYMNFDGATSSVQFVEKASWIPAFNIHYTLGVDGLSLPMVLLTTLLSLISIIASFGIDKRVKEYFFWFLML